MSALDCRTAKSHRWSRISGWCHEGCGVRDDKRVISIATGAVIYTGPTYTPDELEEMLSKTKAVYEAGLAA